MALTRGLDMLLYTNSGTPEAPIWSAISGQKNCTLNRSADSIETTSKDTGGFKTFTTSLKEWSIDLDGMLIFDDASYRILEDAYNDNTVLHVQLKSSAGDLYSGDVIITDFPLEFPFDDMATYSCSLSGASVLEVTRPTV